MAILDAMEKCLVQANKEMTKSTKNEGGEEEKSKGFKYIRIDGTVDDKERQDRVDAFQKDPEIRFAVLSITCAGIGLTLTAATVVVFAEMVWTPALLIQAEDRAHRIGQTGCVTVVYLHAEDTCDDLMWAKLDQKLKMVGATLDGQEMAMDATVTGKEQAQKEEEEEAVDEL